MGSDIRETNDSLASGNMKPSIHPINLFQNAKTVFCLAGDFILQAYRAICSRGEYCRDFQTCPDRVAPI
jgi:hypothetical protein